MSASYSLITVDVALGSDQLSIGLDEESSDKTWELVRTQWLVTDGTQAQGFRSLSVSVEKLHQGFEWFRKVWIDDSRKLEITDKARALINRKKEIGESFRQLIAQGPSEFNGEICEPPHRPLTALQELNVRKLLGMSNGANFSVPGSGKTVMTLATHLTLMRDGIVERLLVVAPKSAYESWEEEARLFGIGANAIFGFSGRPISPRSEIVLTNYEQLQNSDSLEILKRWVSSRPTQVVIDEAHRVKGGPGKARWEACHQLTQGARRVDVLTGTPMPQGFSDVRNIYRLAYPGLSSQDLSDSLISRIQPGTAFVRTTKKELGLPSVEMNLVTEELTDVHAEIYKALRNQYSGLIRLRPRDARELARQGKAVMTLLAVASNPGLLSARNGNRQFLNFKWPLSGYSASSDLTDLIEDYASTEIPWKFIWARSYAERLAKQGRKLIIWTNFVGNILGLEKVLEPLNPVSVFGKHTMEERAESLRRFRADATCSVLITNPMTLGEGISLHTVCHEALYIDRTFNAGLYLQSLDRIHRLGLAEDQETVVTLLASEHTIDANVEQRISFKVNTMAKLLDDPFLRSTAMAVPYDFEDDHLSFSELLDLEPGDMEQLFGHLE